MTALRSYTPDPTVYGRYVVTVAFDRYDSEAGKHTYKINAIGGYDAEHKAMDLARREGWENPVRLRVARVCEGCGATAWHEEHTGECPHRWYAADGSWQTCGCVSELELRRRWGDR